uniref:Uncharacterized protein n=1 Tax=Arion vulgaris TaxID=1028688 RepID=A0A0B7AZQ6_9EUPU
MRTQVRGRRCRWVGYDLAENSRVSQDRHLSGTRGKGREAGVINRPGDKLF